MMSKIKGRYVATVVIDIDYDENDKTNPVEQIRENVCGGALTDAVREVIADWIVDDSIGTLRVTQDYADIQLVESDDCSEGVAPEVGLLGGCDD